MKNSQATRLYESDVNEMVQAYIDSEDPMILDSIIVQTVQDVCDSSRSKGYDLSDAEIDNIADYVEYVVTTGKKRDTPVTEISSKILAYASEEMTDTFEEAIEWSHTTRLTEATGSSYARDYLSQVDDPREVSYEDYLEWLENQGVPEMKISKVWFSTNKNRHLADYDAPVSKKSSSPDPKSSFGRAIAKKRGYVLDDEKPKTSPKVEKPKATPKPIKKSAKRGYDRADQDAVENIIRRAGYRLETMYGEDHPVTIYRGTDKDSLNASVETGDRGPRMDHGGESGDGWMGSAEIDRYFSPYGKKWKPRAEALEQTLRKEGYPAAKVHVNYGEKGHISLEIHIPGPDRKQESFGPMGSPQRGSAEEPIRRNSSGWEKHPDELDYDDDLYDEYDMEADDFFDDEIVPSSRDEEDDIYDEIDDDDGDMWLPEAKRKLTEMIDEDDIQAAVIRYIDEIAPEDAIDTDQIYFYFDEVFNDSYYPESEEDLPAVVEELAEKIMAMASEDSEENYGFDDDDDYEDMRYNNRGRASDDDVKSWLLQKLKAFETSAEFWDHADEIAVDFSSEFPNNDWDDDVAPIVDILMENGHTEGMRLIENSIVNEVMSAVDDLVERGVDIEAAKAKVADRYSDTFNADDLYEILYNDYDEDDDDIF